MLCSRLCLAGGGQGAAGQIDMAHGCECRMTMQVSVKGILRSEANNKDLILGSWAQSEPHP